LNSLIFLGFHSSAAELLSQALKVNPVTMDMTDPLVDENICMLRRNMSQSVMDGFNEGDGRSMFK